MKNRKLIYGVIVLVLVAAIGIGYAAITDTLTINGNMSAAAVTDDQLKGKFKFTQAEKVANCTEAKFANDGLSATMTTASLKKDGSAIAKFTVQNTSEWKLKIEELKINGYTPDEYSNSNEYFEVTCNAQDQVISANGTTIVTVTVTLKKVPVEVKNEEFTITFNGTTVN